MRGYLAVLGILLSLLGIRVFLFFQHRPQYQDGQKVLFTTTLLSEPRTSERFQRITAYLPGGERIFITTTRYPEYHYGDRLSVSGKLKSKLLKGRQILTMSFPKIVPTESGSKAGLALASFVRQKTAALFRKTLAPTPSSLLLGMVFGVKEGMPKEFLEDLRATGILHVIAASGMNVSMVAGFLSALFAFFLKRQVAVVASVIGVLFYALLSGLEPSIVRASIMGAVAFSAQIIGRQYLAFYSLLLAGMGMLFVSPMLIFDVGFQLSFLATLGLILIGPLFGGKGGIGEILRRSVVGEGVVTTVSAQVFVLPILLANFGMYSIFSIPANGLVLWTVPTLMVLGGIGAIVGLALEPLGQLFLYLSLPFLLYFENVVSTFVHFGGILTVRELPWQFVAGYYLIGAAVLAVLYKNRR